MSIFFYVNLGKKKKTNIILTEGALQKKTFSTNTFQLVPNKIKSLILSGNVGDISLFGPHAVYSPARF